MLIVPYTFLIFGNAIQSFAIVVLLFIVSDLEKLTNRTTEKGGWTFRNFGWRQVAITGALFTGFFPIFIAGVSWIEKFVNSSDPPATRREVRELQARILQLEDQLSKKKGN